MRRDDLDTPNAALAAYADGTLPATGAAPAPDPAEPKLLATTQSGVAFPNWLKKFGWTATGTRTNTLGDRAATTVFYTKAARRLAYTIVSGPALSVPGTAPATTIGGVDLRVLRATPAAITWTRAGHTCILTSTGAPAPAPKLLELAAWNGMGAIGF